jgi:hypothetical protein
MGKSMKRPNIELIAAILTCKAGDEKKIVASSTHSNESVVTQDKEIGEFLVRTFKK